MRLVVSDTSPIRALHHLRQLHLLSKLFETVLIPPAVRDELVRPSKRFSSIELIQIPGAVIQAPSDVSHVYELQRQLQTGEAEAIALAEEVNAEILIDERAGRLIALQRGLRVTGVVGLLVESRVRGFIPAVVPLLEQLRTELGFYLSDDLIERARRESKE
jgi:predicted nucleic acid-binding protein